MSNFKELQPMEKKPVRLNKPRFTITEKLYRNQADSLLRKVLAVYGSRQDRQGGFQSKRDENGEVQLYPFIPDTPYVVGNEEGDLLNAIHEFINQRAKLI